MHRKSDIDLGTNVVMRSGVVMRVLLPDQHRFGNRLESIEFRGKPHRSRTAISICLGADLRTDEPGHGHLELACIIGDAVTAKRSELKPHQRVWEIHQSRVTVDDARTGDLAAVLGIDDDTAQPDFLLSQPAGSHHLAAVAAHPESSDPSPQ